MTEEGCMCVCCVYSHMAAQFYAFVSRQVQVTQIDLDITEVVQMQGH